MHAGRMGLSGAIPANLLSEKDATREETVRQGVHLEISLLEYIEQWFPTRTRNFLRLMGLEIRRIA